MWDLFFKEQNTCHSVSISSYFYFTLISTSSGFLSLAVFLCFFHSTLMKEFFPEQVQLMVLFLNNFAREYQSSRLEIYGYPYLPVLSFLKALQISHQLILQICREEGRWEFIFFPFKHTMDFSNSICSFFTPFICTWDSSPAWSYSWTWQLLWRIMTVLQGMISAKFFGRENQAVT